MPSARRDPVPAVQIDAEEYRLGEKSKSLERERHADDGAGVSHETGPEKAELEAQHGAREAPTAKRMAVPLAQRCARSR
jgi:hypothetical protein